MALHPHWHLFVLVQFLGLSLPLLLGSLLCGHALGDSRTRVGLVSGELLRSLGLGRFFIGLSMELVVDLAGLSFMSATGHL